MLQRILQVFNEVDARRNAVDISIDVNVAEGSTQVIVYSACDRLRVFTPVVHKNGHGLLTVSASSCRVQVVKVLCLATLQIHRSAPSNVIPSSATVHLQSALWATVPDHCPSISQRGAGAVWRRM